MLLVRLAPVWVCFLLCLALAGIAARRGQFLPDWRLCWVFAVLSTGVFLILIAEIASAFHALDRSFLATAWIGLDLALALFVVGKFKSDASELVLAAGEKFIFRSRARPIDLAHPHCGRAARVLYRSGVVFALFLGVIAYQAPTFVWDCKSYHVPRLLNWMQDKSLQPFPTSDIRRVAYDPGAEIASTTFFLLDGSDRPINLVSWFSVVTAAIFAGFVAEFLVQLLSEQTGQKWEWDRAALAGAFAFLLVLTIPEGLFQAISTENDFVAALWNLVLACLTILLLREPDNLFYRTAIALALALGICTKATTFISAAPFLAGAFAVLAWRRLYSQAFKLAGVLLIAVTLINAPWFERNDEVFGHFLGPPSVSEINVNPSFTPGRCVANIFRNFSIYTATPSAAVTEAANSVLRALINCTGQTPDDPTSVVPYQDPRQTLHFEMAGATTIKNGDGIGNIHAWLLFGALFILLRFPLRNAFGFYAACVCAGFILSCSYLRWHPWLFRLHITYFVLGLPVVAVAVTAIARRVYVFTLGMLCLANAILILAFNTQYPVYAPFLKLTREQHQFGSNLHLHQPYIGLAEDILQRGCTNVLLHCEMYNFDYGLWVCLRNRGYQGTIEEFQVRNETAKLSQWQFTPRTAMVFIGVRPPDLHSMDVDGRAQPLLQIGYFGHYGTVAALFPSPFADHWWRLIGPDNHADITLTLSGADGIGSNKTADVQFSCRPVNKNGLALANNILRLAGAGRAGDFQLGTNAVEVSATVTEPVLDLRASLLKPIPPAQHPAYLSKLQLLWVWADQPRK